MPQFAEIPNVASYPTGSLDFLDQLDEDQNHNPLASWLSLEIIIVGAGLGGLAAAIALARKGHQVRVFEQAPKLAEVSNKNEEYMMSLTTDHMVLSHPDRTDPSTWRRGTALEEMKKEFRGWDKSLPKVIDMIQLTLKWPLVSGCPLPRWVHPDNKLLIMGDAAHAMVPYMSQGAAMAVEDSAALAQAVSLIHHKSEIPAALRVWEDVRLQRTSQMQEASLINARLWHFKDGPEQVARDQAMRAEVEGKKFVRSPNQWSDSTTQRWCYGYDAEREVRVAWKRGGRLVKGL